MANIETLKGSGFANYGPARLPVEYEINLAGNNSEIIGSGRLHADEGTLRGLARAGGATLALEASQYAKISVERYTEGSGICAFTLVGSIKTDESASSRESSPQRLGVFPVIICEGGRHMFGPPVLAPL